MTSRQVPSRFTCPPQGSDPCCNQPLHPCLHRQIFLPAKSPAAHALPPKSPMPPKSPCASKSPASHPVFRVGGSSSAALVPTPAASYAAQVLLPPPPVCTGLNSCSCCRPNQRLDSLPPTSRTCTTPTALLQGALLPALLLFLKPLTCMPFTPHSQRKCTTASIA